MRGKYRRARRSVGVISALALLLALLSASPAGACSPAPKDQRDNFNGAEAAFTGTLLERNDISEYEADFTFEVDEDFKDTLGDTVVVRSPANGGMCGIGVGVGSQTTLLAHEDDEGRLRSGLADQISPETMEMAAGPLPEPTGEGEAVMLVGGSFGETRVLALDKRGRILGYGYGEGDVQKMSLCPGSEVMVETAGHDGGQIVAIRSISDLSVQREVALPPGSIFDVMCVGRRGGRSLVSIETYEDGEAVSRVLRLEGDAWRTLYQGSFEAIDLRAGKALLLDGRRLHVHSFDDGTEYDGRAQVAKLPGHILEARWSDDGDHIAGSALPRPGDGSRLTVFVVRPNGLARRSLPAGAFDTHLTWIGPKRFVTSSEGLILDTKLVRRGSVGYSGDTFDAAAYRRWYYAVAWGRLTRVHLRRDVPEIMRAFISPITWAIEPIPDGAEVDAPPHS